MTEQRTAEVTFSWHVWACLGFCAIASGALLRTHWSDFSTVLMWGVITWAAATGAFLAGLEYQRQRREPDHA